VLWLKKSKDNQTVLLNQNNDNYGIAILSEGLPGTPQENEGLRAFILLDEFIIGRDESQADLYLDDKTIGRKHARITRREGEFFLTDLGSKNGTRIDGRKINKNEDIMLPDRCRLHFADRAFFFQNEEPL
jgi:pSer/pThr/pTyr-binding forkhead associated (FHA) protein